jgi:DNA polymerase elongation subunit (family B)
MFGEGDIKENNNEFIYVNCKNSKEIIEKFRDCVIALDLDIITGWNTYGFDYIFLHNEYESYFLPKNERGNESNPYYKQKTPKIQDLFQDFQSNPRYFDWFKKAERKHGIKNMYLLKKECNALNKKKPNDTKSLFIEEDEEELMDSISIKAMNEIRLSLLVELKGIAREISLLRISPKLILCKTAAFAILTSKGRPVNFQYFSSFSGF